jgi:hypothetical protein
MHYRYFFSSSADAGTATFPGREIGHELQPQQFFVQEYAMSKANAGTTISDADSLDIAPPQLVSNEFAYGSSSGLMTCTFVFSDVSGIGGVSRLVPTYAVLSITNVASGEMASVAVEGAQSTDTGVITFVHEHAAVVGVTYEYTLVAYDAAGNHSTIYLGHRSVQINGSVVVDTNGTTLAITLHIA